jgi:uncharacterized protein (TIGR00255 family)
MIKSMTGFGKAATTKDEYVVKAEVRSLNSKYMDVSLRIPGVLREKEYAVRALLNEKIIRGKVDVQITVEFTSGGSGFAMNKELLKFYYKEIKEVAKELGENNPDIFRTVLKLPEVFSSPAGENIAPLWNDTNATLNEAIENLDKFRLQEGEKLKEEFTKLISNIKSYLDKANSLDPQRMAAVKEKLNTLVIESGMKEKVDANRFEQELIYYLERMDFTEERVRLLHHCGYFISTMNDEQANGRKLNFIAQEMGREINTLGAKAYHSGIQQQVVMMKDELEKIKEQLMNVL